MHLNISEKLFVSIKLSLNKLHRTPLMIIIVELNIFYFINIKLPVKPCFTVSF